MTKFEVYPAIDLKDGRCVRLLHGIESNQIIYEQDPIRQVSFFVNSGFNWIHIVDLNAAFGRENNKKIILKILKQFKSKINFQLGGGIRSVEDLKFWIDSGVRRVVTVSYTHLTLPTIYSV